MREPAQSALWNELTEHPLGKAALVGAQCRYLLGSWLAPWGLQPRLCAWHRATAGWDDEMREQRLHRVVGLSRFRPACRSVASAEPVVAAQDFEERYRPWLVETFPAHHSGARTWVRVGETCGRGRQAGWRPNL